MAQELLPLVLKLKAWRVINYLSRQRRAFSCKTQGLPVTLKTLRNWEIGRVVPNPLRRRYPGGFPENSSESFYQKRSQETGA
jgi:hypothetical protein